MLTGSVLMDCGRFVTGNAKLPSLNEVSSVKPPNDDEAGSSTGLGVPKPYKTSDMVRTIPRSTHGSKILSSDVYRRSVVRDGCFRWQFS